MTAHRTQARSVSSVSFSGHAFSPNAVLGLIAGDPALGMASTCRSTRRSFSSTNAVACLEGSMRAGDKGVIWSFQRQRRWGWFGLCSEPWPGRTVCAAAHARARATRRNALSLAGSLGVGLIGANALTRDDAVLSVHAGLPSWALAALWPTHLHLAGGPGAASGWQWVEYPAVLCSHCFHGERRDGAVGSCQRGSSRHRTPTRWLCTHGLRSTRRTPPPGANP